MSGGAKRPGETPAYCDCPPCPQCGATAGTRVGGEAAAIARHAGPSWLSCSACGATWEASDADVAQAAKADAAWVAESERQNEERCRSLGLAPGARIPLSALLAEYGGDAVGRLRADGTLEIATRERDLS